MHQNIQALADLISNLCFVLFAHSAETSPAVLKHVGYKFHDVFQLKQACYTDIPVTKILEMMESNSLEVSCQHLLCFTICFG